MKGRRRGTIVLSHDVVRIGAGAGPQLGQKEAKDSQGRQDRARRVSASEEARGGSKDPGARSPRYASEMAHLAAVVRV
jgi:hypothetical protein